MDYDVAEYRRRLRGCFTGKCVGGTLGMPFEGFLGISHVDYYDPVPTEMVANDDLDLQVVALEQIRRRGLPISSRYLAEQWTEISRCWPDEYGVAKRNMDMLLCPPLSGYYGNAFHGGMGAAIRSELYACLAPADPDLAVRLCLEDACTDHSGDGVDACAFLTAVESAAFRESSIEALIETGLKYVRSERMKSAFRDVVALWSRSGDMLWVREQILTRYPSQNWTDVTINLSLILLAWLAGEGDFSRCICAAANMGYDADCTCATLGAILGIIEGDTIEERWTRPIGDALVLSTNIIGMHAPDTVTEFCEQILETCAEVQRYYGSACRLTGEIPAWTGAPAWTKPEYAPAVDPEKPTDAIIAVTPLEVTLTYPDQVACRPDTEEGFGLRIRNTSDADLHGRFLPVVPDGFTVIGGAELHLKPGECAETVLRITLQRRFPRRPYRSQLDLIFLLGGIRYTVTAGLVAPYPRRIDGIPADQPSHLITFGSGPHICETDFTAHTDLEQIRFLCQGTRPVRVTIDGDLVSEHDDSFYVPAFHRNPDTVLLPYLCRGRHRIRIEIAEGDNMPGELFLMFATRFGWDWIQSIEWNA